MSIWEQPFESKSETSHTFTTKYLIVLFPKNKGIFSITTIYSYQKQKINTDTILSPTVHIQVSSWSQ